MRAVILPACRRSWSGLLLIGLAFLLAACQPGMAAGTPDATGLPAAGTKAPASPTPPAATSTPGLSPTPPTTHTPTPGSKLPAVDPGAGVETAPPTTDLEEATRLAVEDWKEWSIVPQVPARVRNLYQQGLALGNDPHAFSIIGDCQSLPETFLGVYDTDPALVASLPPALQAVVANFSGSFNRQSPTIKGGTTAGAVLWSEWHEMKFTCQENETPLDCELRLHKPSFVIINLGTHYETRNITYLQKILDRLTGQGIVPILATKADNRELDDRLNQEMASLALEYEIPLWNFYAAVSDLPNNGVGVKRGEEHLGEIYLSEEGLERHRFTALQALAAVWQAATE